MSFDCIAHSPRALQTYAEVYTLIGSDDFRCSSNLRLGGILGKHHCSHALFLSTVVEQVVVFVRLSQLQLVEVL